MSAAGPRLFAILLPLAVTACGADVPVTAGAAAPARAPTVTLDAAAQQQAGIVVAPAAIEPRTERTDAPGVIALDERRTARIGSLVEGVVLTASAEAGDRVASGQALALIHGPVVHEAWASYRKAVAERRRVEKELAFTTAAQERTRRLYADKAVSLQDVQRAEADRANAEETLDMARTEVRRSEEELQHLGITNAEDPSGEAGEYIPIRTPTAGVVLERLVTPGTAVTPGMPLYVVSNLSTLWALLDIDESLLSHVGVGQPVDLRVAAYPDETFPATAALVGDMVNPRTHRVTVRCTVDNRDGRLKPQMYVTAVIRGGTARPAVVVPSAAIQTIDGRPTIFVADAGGQFRPRAVDLGATIGGRVEIRAGVRAGEPVVVDGGFILKSELLKASAPKG